MCLHYYSEEQEYNNEQYPTSCLGGGVYINPESNLVFAWLSC